MTDRIQESWTAVGTFVYAGLGESPIAEAWKYPAKENARFIATAPDMEKALEDFTEHHHCPAAICPVQDAALAALAKARGRQ